ncbi:Biosynthetic Aromatic amino acid aminotransferase beta [Leucobacter sp. 7(1)]|uniref:histidinol-phosphate transaminase n=1 Tax=Leucobacter sp. 7(1) TaxID=1255613 RepID=UPI00097E7717|nr:histidinol-phosphate transaminase [Leucobacter sp. 7(1)]SJN13262.1 Biosynthetic Aromatic amino acid aminotransferase beta [Leucobacter sp. 7(1)]
MSPISLREGLDTLPPYVPGTRPDGGPEASPPPVRAASNEAPAGPHDSVRAAVAEAAAELHRYPEFSSGTLGAALAERAGLSPEHVTVGTGSSALIRDLVTALCGPGDEVVFAQPSFPYYRNATVVAGATPVPVPLRELVHDLDALLAAVTSATRLLFLCNPNNPTGTVLSADAIRAFLARVPEHVVVAVDEAYIEYSPDASLAADVGRDPRLVILRTFSKAYGLAGARVGYALGDPRLIAGIARVAVPFGVSMPAQAAALALLAPEAQQSLAERIADTVAERKRLAADLRRGGWAVVESGANFLFLDVAQPADLAQALQERGILVRSVGGGVRMTIATPEENARVQAALESLGAQR